MVAGINPNDASPHITVRDLTMAFGSFVLMRDLSFTVNHGDVFIIMGGSGSGKSTLLRHMIGLIEPAKGNIFYGDENFTKADFEQRQELLRRMNENKDKQVALSGHTDNIGTEAYNMGLSNRRWMSVRDYVVKKGVDGGRVSGQGFGESKPIASNATAEGRAKNRRVEIKVN